MAFNIEVTALKHLFRNVCRNIRCISTVSRGHNLLSPSACGSDRRGSVPVLIEASSLKTFSSSMNHMIPSFAAYLMLTGPVLTVSQQRFYAKAPPTKRKKLSFQYSGDLMTQSPLNPQDTRNEYKDLSELKSSPEIVKKLCTLDFASGQEKKIHRKEVLRERIVQLFGPDAHREMHVAALTVEIRNLIPHVLEQRKDKFSKCNLIEKIQERKKILKFLRREDYQRFMWLLQELKIRYVLPPEYYRQKTRKFQQKQRVWKRANALRLKKIAEYRQKLEREWEEFKKYKEETLRQIEEDIGHFQLDRESFEKGLRRKREGKTYPRIYTWEERQQMQQDLALK